MKIKKNIIYLIIILFIILIAILIAINIIKKDEEQMSHRVMGVDFSDTVHLLKVSNLSVLEDFVGTQNDKGFKIGKKFTNFFTDEVPKIKKEIQEYQDYSQYYLKVKEEIAEYFTTDEQSFINLCNKIKLMESDVSTEYDTCNFSLNETKNILIITCLYQNGETITINMSHDENVTI